MSDIPRARRELERLADDVERNLISVHGVGRRLRSILPLLDRKPALRSAPRNSRRITPALAAEIRAFVDTDEAHGMTIHQIATKFGVNSGRVSEAINRER